MKGIETKEPRLRLAQQVVQKRPLPRNEGD